MGLPLTLELIILLIIIVAFILMRAMYKRTVKLQQKAQMSMLFTSITHELLTPLTIISASVEHLREQEPKYKAECDLIELNIRRSVKLLQQILETAKSEDGRLKLLVSQGDVMEYIRSTAMTTIPLMKKKGLEFSIECHPKSMMGWIDTDKIDKIIFNLIVNAVKYSRSEGGKIDLKVTTNDHFDHVIIEVSDNGRGIPKSRQKHLFEMFYDGEYRRYNTMGTGVGLALTNALVMLIEGTITCESEEGQGARFTLTLPISKEAFAKDQIDTSHKVNIDVPRNNIIDAETVIEAIDVSKRDDNAKTNTSEDAYKILLVEDNYELLMLMRQLLSSKYEIYTAVNGQEALDIIARTDLDLVISDVMMPVMDGYELTQRIKANADTSHLPVILLTARTQESDKIHSIEIGADIYMTKPFRMEELTLRINNLVENRQRIQHEFKAQSLEETQDKVTVPSPDNEFMRRAMECIHSHLDDSDYDRESFAADMNMSSSSLYNKLRAITGLSVSSFMRDIRMKEACRIVRDDPTIRVSSLAYKVGYRDPKYFATTFKKEMGMQPSEYIESMSKGDA